MNPPIDLRFDRDHPTAAGHFPADPIVPGALLLDAVIESLEGIAALRGIPVIRATKYLRPVRPGDACRLHWQQAVDGAVRFECRLGDTVAVIGTLVFEPVAP
jgi:3-hydroxyacyl-[acyl-carrier-protein] dehydratase